MTIKQQGGIFGRNPTFNDLTVEGTLNSTGSMTVDELGIGTSTVTFPLTLESDNTSWISRLYNTRTDANAQGLLVRSDSTSAANATILGLYADGGYKFKFTANGNMVVGTAGGGIDFSATSGTGTSELFSDYEEGSWTPVIAGNTTAGSNTYTVQNGYYTKIGNRVLINLDIAMSNKDAAMDGTVVITGLPFTPSTATNNAASMAFGRYDNVNLSAGYTQLVAMVQSNGTFLPREVGDNVAAQIIDDAAMSNTSRFQLSGHYFV